MYTYMYKFMRNYVHQNCPLCLSFNRYSKQCNNSALPFAINKYLFKNLKLMIFQYINHHQPFVKIYICIHVYLTTSLFREQQIFDSKWQVPRCNSCAYMYTWPHPYLENSNTLIQNDRFHVAIPVHLLHMAQFLILRKKNLMTGMSC